MKGEMAKDLFEQYRVQAKTHLANYVALRMSFPFADLTPHARRVWRTAALAEMWAIIATQLSGGQVDYIEVWRTQR